MKKICIYLLALASYCSCQEKENTIIENYNELNSDIITNNEDIMKEVLIKQLKAGYKSKHLDLQSYYNYNDDDFEAISILTEDILIKNGYRINGNDFKNRVKKIFNIDLNKKITHFLYNPFQCEFKEVGQKAYEPYYYGNFYFILHFDLDKNIMPYEFFIPEILNYQETFPKLNEFDVNFKFTDSDGNEDITIPWKEKSNISNERNKNIQLILNRNLYLFNDDKSKLPWLLKNDEGFMKSLVLTFGWTEDEKLLKWVIENNKYDKNNPLEFGKMFYTKKCDGSLKLHANTFKYLQKTVTPQNDQILDDIKSFVSYYANFKNKVEDLNERERLEVLSNIVYFAQQYKYEKGFDNRRIMSWMYLTSFDQQMQILEQSNYFNLPKFKHWWDEQYTDGDYDIVVDINDGVRDDY